ncbi:helix-turn-helix domain-containing protein [Marinomonas sp. TI.3.20]|uniref:GlxA family transcriptional regulator n=1 Tax=Marinomonas sp. TI.3.20 TaxID=3121296 RepID=UPI00311FF93D
MTINVSIILMPGFALTSFSLTVEAFSVANLVHESEIYNCSIFSGSIDPSEKCVVSSNGVPIMADKHIIDFDKTDIICLCAYKSAPTYEYDVLSKLLRKHYSSGGEIASLSSGCFILAKSGVLKHSTCTVTDEQKSIFQELYPKITVLDNLYTVSNRLYTCKGGTTALDMMMYIIGLRFGTELTQQISSQFQADRVRTLEEINKSNKYLALRIKSPALGAAIELMESNIEQPYSIESLCEMIGCSVRRLEMIFKKFLGITPNKKYLYIRLKHAYKLIEETNLPISEISNACGFSSHSYMGQCFKNRYGIYPSSLR